MSQTLPFSVSEFRSHFPLISCHYTSDSNHEDHLIYFDNAATTQKPLCVISAFEKYYNNCNANVHRASHALSTKATLAFENARLGVKNFLNASSEKEIIWTKGTTESINLVATSLGKNLLKSGDEIVLSACEHHANIVPWQLIAKTTGAVIKVLPLDDEGCIEFNALHHVISSKTKLVCCAHISNVIGKINPIESIIKRAKEVGAITLIDGAQAVAHIKVDVQKLDCDFYVFSAHKMFGPTGVGVLYGKRALLEKMTPYQSGGEMIKKVSFHQETTFNELPFKFEAGTPNIAGVVAFEQAVNFCNIQRNSDFYQYEKSLTAYCYKALKKLPEVKFIVAGQPDIPVMSFTVENHHNQDIATTLDSMGIALRSGHHCAMPLMEALDLPGCLRVSLAPYNTKQEVDYFIQSLKSIISSDRQAVESMGAVELVSDAFQEESHAIEPTNNTQVILSAFAQTKGWDERHRVIMLLSKELPRLAIDKRNEQALIEGCESKAWLIASKNEQGLYHFEADSDAKVIRGLFVVVLAALNDQSGKQIQSFDIDKYFNELGLMRHLSPSRGNGVLAIVDKIKTLAL